ncbi:xanthine dehydrogenase family protein molybdopterin-binding subunit [Thermohalobacter berrensis]|uniref:Nicotinate dehydrogenase medium molybdopterin subunit n=1 Tax=Thermohalobacter berrensis TaxID=99594 RepID=A0A419T2M9_9FIRM|nr:molybdopterin cofactor-binding domain-containing protein [Thermohalobacter berrensis]RKD31668.1 nicotinate dehydrogenase medium molybdopterin subunit [Thermohalobacter berrensis]
MKKRGIGIGSIFYGTGYGNGFPDVSKAVAQLKSDGKIAIYVGATEVGQGAKTALSQIAAEVLGLSVDDIVFINEDTSITPDSGTAAASRQTYNTGNAIKLACEKLKRDILEVAKDYLGLNSIVGLTLKNGYVYPKTLPEKRVSLGEISESLESSLKEEAVFTAQTTEMDEETGQGAPYWPYTFSACGVEVEVDTETGRVEIIRAVLAQDVGRAINPELIEGQIDGGFAMGAGYALYEDLKIEKGKIKNNSFTNYLIPTSLDMPDIEKVIIEDPESTAPYGAKGIGEPVMIPVAPAILNAIYDAVGVRMTEIPVTPEKLLKAIKEKEMTYNEGKN